MGPGGRVVKSAALAREEGKKHKREAKEAEQVPRGHALALILAWWAREGSGEHQG